MVSMEDYIQMAFQLAEEALENGEVPVGCVFVYSDTIIGRGRNTVNVTHNATRHAEMNAIDQVIAWAKDRNLSLDTVMKNTKLYVNVEPCAMCADAMYQLGLGSVVYGCSNDKFGGFGSLMDVGKFHPELKIDVVKGVRADDAVCLFKKFYSRVNPNAPADKVKLKNKTRWENSNQ